MKCPQMKMLCTSLIFLWTFCESFVDKLKRVSLMVRCDCGSIHTSVVVILTIIKSRCRNRSPRENHSLIFRWGAFVCSTILSSGLREPMVVTATIPDLTPGITSSILVRSTTISPDHQSRRTIGGIVLRSHPCPSLSPKNLLIGSKNSLALQKHELPLWA